VASEWEIDGFVYTKRLLDSLESEEPFPEKATRLEKVLFFAYLPAHAVDRSLGGPPYANVWGPM
jgi:hypothetical protein